MEATMSTLRQQLTDVRASLLSEKYPSEVDDSATAQPVGDKEKEMKAWFKGHREFLHRDFNDTVDHLVKVVDKQMGLVQDTRKALGYLGPTFDKRATALEKEWSSALRRAQDHWLRRNMMPELMEKFNIGQRAHGPLDVPARKVVCSALRMHKKHWDLVLGAHVRVKDVTEKVAEECQGLLKAQKDKNTEERRAAAQQAIDRERQALADEKVKLAAEKTAFQAELRAFSALRTFAKILPKPKDHHAVNRRTQINKQRLAEYLVSAE